MSPSSCQSKEKVEKRAGSIKEWFLLTKLTTISRLRNMAINDYVLINYILICFRLNFSFLQYFIAELGSACCS